MLPRNPVRPVGDTAVMQLDDRMAAVAGEVMVVSGRTGAVAGACAVLERVDQPGVDEHAERTVDGRKAQVLSRPGEVGVQGLCRCVAVDITDSCQHGDALVGCANAGCSQRVAGIFGGGSGHRHQRSSGSAC